MNPEKETYTYTARDAVHPNQLVTFTLYEQIRPKIMTQAQPIALNLASKLIGPAHLRDMHVRLNGDHLEITLWQRLAGLRLFPIFLDMGVVDNFEAAQAFVQEVEQRQQTAPYPGKFLGPLDYWFGWFAWVLILKGIEKSLQFLLVRRKNARALAKQESNI